MRDENELTGADAGDDGADDLVIRRAARELQAPVAFGADFDARVMAAVRAAAADDAVERRASDAERALPVRGVRDARGVRRAWAWATRPRTLRVSPLAGLAAAAALALVTIGVGRDGIPGSAARESHDERVVATTDTGPYRPVSDAPRAVAPQQVQFVLVAPSAKSVALVGDFNDWSAVPLTPVQTGGAWTITVPLAPGRYTYNFVVDGTRVMPDPAAPEAPADDFGTPASVVTVAGVQS